MENGSRRARAHRAPSTWRSWRPRWAAGRLPMARGSGFRRWRRSGGAKVAERPAQLLECRRPDLRDPAHRQPENVGDLLELELLEEVEREDGPLLLLQRHDGTLERLDFHFTGQQIVHRDRAIIREQVAECDIGFGTRRLMERHDVRAVRVEFPAVQLVRLYRHVARDLARRGGT